MRRLSFLLVLTMTAATILACGSGTHKRIVTRPDTYDKLMGFPATGNRLDIRDLEAEYPELKGLVVYAEDYIEEYDKYRKEKLAKGEPVVEYRIPSGSSVTIEVVDEPKLSKTYTIGPHGFIYYPYIGELHVQGLSVRQLKASLEQKLTKFLKHPQVLVHVSGSVQGYQSESGAIYPGAISGGIFMFGAVQGRGLGQQGGYRPYSGGESLVSVLGTTGLPSNADWRQVRIIRRSKDDPLRKSRIILSDLWAFFAHGDMRQDVPLMPGDIVYIPVKHTVGDQFSKDWNMTLGYFGDLFTIQSFRKAMMPGGTLRE